MIARIENIRTTSASHPFATAVGKKGFTEAGYVEDEYFITGIANIYERQGAGKGIRYAGAPYVNRILVRKPGNAARFSGNVVVEILNSTSYFDIDRIWALTATHLMNNGDIYVGITSKPNVIDALLQFDAMRYAPLCWRNPLEYDIPDEELGNLVGHSHKETEDGLFWDMLMDLGRLLRSDTAENPIHDYWNADSYLYLAGWSQSGSYMIRYIRDFARQEGEGIYDGYYSCGSISIGTPNLNQEDMTCICPQEHTLNDLDRPYIDMHTESDNVQWGNAIARQTHSAYYRVYDITGSSHDTTTTMEEYYAGDQDLRRIGRTLEFPGSEPHANSYPYEYAYRAGLELLYQWVREGRAPMQVAPVEYNKDCANMQNENQRPATAVPAATAAAVRDSWNIRGADGNSLGGWRLPMITYPVCAYYNHSTPPQAELALPCALYGYEEPYSTEELIRRYGSLQNYQRLITDETDRCIDAGLLLAEDRTAYIRRAVWTAERYGLR